ncbi:unnamed protein product [Penicillium nalgiovense]|uniref:Glucose 1-dehydrogenase n=1 Tax=Penicillium nalgiovense TaxID=60175 RepID=A0A9W4MXU6_PENNA|nr:unnamed protein product [Penicillium nalgiovense]CAG7965888.1 unnamed protein product [Penicillium nalgiovense]CAG7969678.1 unnamed protein product [Penicillium nalgiovense]CAG8002574.1 unnamed protein product [Penicillium nalgiovense]CAG8011066.1 unnamed protein product [Penicillium nalgiovense]
MVGRLEGKNAIVTGAAGGIGLETTILMLREGASVLMADISDEGLNKALSKVNSVVPASTRTGKVETKVVDVSNETHIEASVAHLDAWGGLDIIFNNAGIMHPKDGDSEECPEDIWDRTMNINVKGVWFGSKHAVRAFRRHGKKRASVINTASMVALVGAATPQLAYTASKGAVLAMTRELAIVHAREGFRFNSLCPAPLKYVEILPLSRLKPLMELTFNSTPLLQDWLGDDKEKRFRREVHFPTGRFGEAVEQAHAVIFLASDESSFVNATDFVVDGGLTKAYVTPEGPATEAPKNLAA